MILTGSRYTQVAIVRTVNVQGVQAQPDFLDLDTRARREFPDSTYIQVGPSDGWASLGLRYLQDARAWWAIAVFSGVIDPFFELEPGTILTCPSVSRYYFTLMESPK